MIRKTIPIVLILIAICMLILAGQAITSQGTESQVPIEQLKQQAIEYIWTGAAGDGLWSTAGNWDPAGPPPHNSGNVKIQFSEDMNMQPITIPAGFSADCTFGDNFGSIFGPAFGMHLDISGSLTYKWYLSAGQTNPAGQRSIINMYSNSSMDGAEGLAIGDNWWLPGPYVTMNMYGDSTADVKWLWVGGHLNMYGGTLNIRQGINMCIRHRINDDANNIVKVDDALTRVDIYAGKMILPGDVNKAVIEDWISRGILLAYGRTPGTEGCNIIIDTKTMPGRTIITATSGSDAIAETYYREKPDEAQLWSQMELAVSSIESKKDSEAKMIVERLLTDFKSNPRLPQALAYIADMYKQAKKYDEASEIHNTIITKWPETRTAGNAKYESDKMKVYILLDSKDEPNALKTIDNFFEQYKSRSDLAAVLYDFAARYDWINNGQVSELSKEIYGRVTASFPNTVQSRDSSLIQKKAEIFSLIDSGDDANAIISVDKFIADYKGSQLLPEAVYRIGEIYWNTALEAERGQNDSDALPDFKKASQVWEKIENLMPFSAPDVIEYTYYGLSNCYHRLGEYKKASEYYNKILTINPIYIKGFKTREFICGDRFCGAYSVWYTLQFSGLSESIEDIVKEMGIYNKGFSSIYDIVKILNSKGIDCQAVRINFDNAAKLDKPFIQYLAPKNGNSIGHFVLCVPNSKGKAVVLDGIEEPKIIDLYSYKEDNIMQTRWDGTVIFIEGLNPDFKQNLISWNSALLYSIAWLDDAENIDLRFIEERLSLEIQKHFIGGWTPIDCNTVGANCSTNVICNQKQDNCPAGTPICGDSTQEEKCQFVSYSASCYYTESRTCFPKCEMTGLCVTGYECGKVSKGVDCGSLSGVPRQWISQCN